MSKYHKAFEEYWNWCWGTGSAKDIAYRAWKTGRKYEKNSRCKKVNR